MRRGGALPRPLHSQQDVYVVWHNDIFVDNHFIAFRQRKQFVLHDLSERAG